MSLIPKKKAIENADGVLGFDDEYAVLDESLDESDEAMAAGISAASSDGITPLPDTPEEPSAAAEAEKASRIPEAGKASQTPEAEEHTQKPENNNAQPEKEASGEPAAEAPPAPSDAQPEAGAGNTAKLTQADSPFEKTAPGDTGKPDDFSDLFGSDEGDDGKKSKKKKRKDSKAKNSKDGKDKKRKKPKRKGRFITPLILLSIVLMLILVAVCNVFYCMNNFEINFYQIESMHVSSDIRIVVLSDVHLSEYGEDNADLIEAIQALEPDLIISAGDLVTYGEDNYDNMLSLCSQLVEIAPTYGIMGNHEDEKVYLENDEEMRQKFKDTDMELLINKSKKIRVKGNDIELVGVSGGPDGFDQYGGKTAMEKLGENNSALRIVIAHVPTLFTDRLDEYDFDIGIAGHTHGGVVRLPMIGGLYSAEEGFLPDFDGGLYDLKNGATLFVSRGLGNSGKIPRFNNTPELAVIDVRWY